MATDSGMLPPTPYNGEVHEARLKDSRAVSTILNRRPLEKKIVNRRHYCEDYNISKIVLPPGGTCMVIAKKQEGAQT